MMVLVRQFPFFCQPRKNTQSSTRHVALLKYLKEEKWAVKVFPVSQITKYISRRYKNAGKTGRE